MSLDTVFDVHQLEYKLFFEIGNNESRGSNVKGFLTNYINCYFMEKYGNYYQYFEPEIRNSLSNSTSSVIISARFGKCNMKQQEIVLKELLK